MQFPKSFHKPFKKWKVKSEKGGRQFVKSVEGKKWKRWKNVCEIYNK